MGHESILECCVRPIVLSLRWTPLVNVTSDSLFSGASAVDRSQSKSTPGESTRASDTSQGESLSFTHSLKLNSCDESSWEISQLRTSHSNQIGCIIFAIILDLL